MQTQTQKTKVAERPTLILCVIYALIGFSSLYFGNKFQSVTLKSSGIDSLVGSLTEGLLLFGLIASRDNEEIDDGYYFGYGHWRSTIIMNLIVSLFIFYGGCQVVYGGIQSLTRFFRGINTAPDQATIFVAGAVLIILAIVLGYFAIIARKNPSSSLKESMMDLRSDLMTNAMVIVAVIAARRFHIYWLDGSFGILIGLLIVKGSMELFRSAILYLLDATPEKQVKIYANKISQVSNVQKVKSLKTHWVGDGLVILDVVIVVDGQMTIEQSDQLKQQIGTQMKEYPEISDLNMMISAH